MPQSQDEYTWPPLLNGQEHSSSIDLRRQTFETLWARYQSKIDDIVNRPDEKFVAEVLDYVRGETGRGSRLRTGLIVSGTTKNAQRDLSLGWKNAQSQDTTDLLVQLHPNVSPNLQTALKNVIRLAISQHGGLDEYSNFLTRQKSLIPMNFDLELLQRYVKRHQVSRVVVSIQDVETFDTGVISELISTLSSWSGRIPFILLIDISTTVELFESRLSRSTWALLDAQVFELTQNKIDPLFEAYRVFQYDDDADVFLGPSPLNVLSDLAEDQSTTVEGSVRAIKYLMMTHFFANAVSVLTAKTTLEPAENKSICQAIRNMPEFQKRCDALLKDRSKTQKVRDLILADDLLLEDSIGTVRSNQAELKALLKGVHLLHTIYDLLPLPIISPLKLEADLLSNLPNLVQSDPYLDIEDAVKSLNQEGYRDLIGAVSAATTGTEFSRFEVEEDVVVDEDEALSTPTRPVSLKQLSLSADDDTNPSSPPTIFIHLLRSYLLHTSTDPSSSPSTSLSSSSSTTSSPSSPRRKPWTTYLATASTINGRNPLASVVHAGPRFALERALTRPADYLSCACCSTSTAAASRSDLPCTSLLLTLLNEAGNIVNVRDLWEAFRESLFLSSSPSAAAAAAVAITNNRHANGGDKATVDGIEDGHDDNDANDDDELRERQALALFYRGLAELRHLGFVKPSKRKPGVDCIARTAWMGL